MSNNERTEKSKTSHKIEGLAYEPLGMPTERVIRLNARYGKNDPEHSRRQEIIRHLITPAELMHRTQNRSPFANNSSHANPAKQNEQADIYAYSRRRMVNEQLIARGITDENVLRAMACVPRHLFVNEALYPTAYDDRPLPIACGQTISQPYTVALMCQMLMAEKGMKVLEIGTGSGYQAAILREMGLKVFSVERIKELYTNTKSLLTAKFGYYDMQLFLSDGTLGLELFAPYDRIIVAAGGPDIPEALKAQLADNGIMLIPVGKEKMTQNLIRVFKMGNSYREENLGTTTFVDLIGKQGW